MSRVTKFLLILSLSGFLTACGESVTQNQNVNPSTTTDGLSDGSSLSGTDQGILGAILGKYCGTLTKNVNNVVQSQSFTLDLSTQNITGSDGQTQPYAYMVLTSNGQIGNVQINQPMGLTLNGVNNTYGFITDVISNPTLRANPFEVALQIGLNSQNQFLPQNSSLVFRDCQYGSLACLTDATDVTVSGFNKCY